jgi:hypothetical protein
MTDFSRLTASEHQEMISSFEVDGPQRKRLLLLSVRLQQGDPVTAVRMFVLEVLEICSSRLDW